VTIETELHDALEAAAARHHVPGAAMGVLQGDDCCTAAYGVTNAEHPAPVSPATLFQVASITKTFAAAAVMVLVQEGRLALDDPVARHLPDLGPATGMDFEAITIELALSHQSGFDGDHLFVTRATRDLTALKDARRLFPPGQGFSYSNAGFSIAGAVVEAVSGQTFAAFATERLLNPLGLWSAGFTADHAITHSVAAPHWVNDDKALVIRGAGWQPGWELGPVDHAAAGLAASAEHLMTWARFQSTGTALDGSVVLTPESLQRLHTPVVNADRLEDIALDWHVRDLDGARSIEHGGVTAGYISNLLIVPERDFACAVLTNATNGSWVVEEVRRWALQRFAGITERDPEPDPELSVDVERFCGTYVHSFSMLTVTAGEDPGTIVVTASPRDDVPEGAWQPPVDPPFTCAFFADDHVVSTAPAGPARVASFEAAEDGPASWIQWSGRRAPRVD
jgi:CubicO group peptidase (beta-lactamase class C family)